MLFVGKGFVVQLGDSQYPLRLLPFILTLPYCANIKKIPPSVAKAWIFMILCFCISIILLLTFPSNAWVAAPPYVTWDAIIFGNMSPVHPSITHSVVLMTIKFILFSFVYLYIYTQWKYEHYKKFLSKLSNISNIFIILAIIEVFIKNVLRLNNLWGEIDLAFWGDTTSTVHTGRLRGFLYESCLFNKESSIHAYSFFIVSLIKIANNILNDKTRKIDYYIILCYVLMFLSTSFTSVILILSFVAIYITYRWGVLRPNTMGVEKIIVAVTLLLSTSFSIVIGITEDDFILRRLFNLFENVGNYLTFDIDYGHINTYDDISTYIRTLSIMQTLKAFIERPLFGYSLFAIWCHGPTATLLASLGIVGFICWIRFYFWKISLKYMVQPQSIPFSIGIGIYFLLLFFCGGSGQLSPFSFFMPLVFIVCNCFIFAKNENKCNYNML